MKNVYGTFTGVSIYRQCLKHSVTNMSQCHVFLYESHMVCIGLKPGSPRLEALALWLLYLPPVLSFNLVSIYHTTYTISMVRTCSCAIRFSARTSACERRIVLFRNQARRCRSGTLYSSRQTLCRDCQIAFHYTCGKLSGLGLSTKWLLKHNSLSVPFPVGTVSAMLIYQYAV